MTQNAMTHNANHTSAAPASTRHVRGRVVLALVATLMLVLAAGSVLALQGEKRGDFLPPAGYLNLDDEQRAVARELLRGLVEENAPLRQESRRLALELRDQLNAEPQDAQAIGETAIALHAQREQIRAARAAANTEFEAVLDDEQLLRWQHFLELRTLVRHPRAGADPLGAE